MRHGNGVTETEDEYGTNKNFSHYYMGLNPHVLWLAARF
jgi:hypothetical protein